MPVALQPDLGFLLDCCQLRTIAEQRANDMVQILEKAQNERGGGRARGGGGGGAVGSVDDR